MTKLYEAGNHILLDTDSVCPAAHRHTAAHIILSLRNHISVTTGSQTQLCRGILIPSSIPHKIDTHGNPVLVFLYDCTTRTARHIQTMTLIPDEVCDRAIQMYKSFDTLDSAGPYQTFQEHLLNLLHIPAAACCITDPRISAALDHIRRSSSEKITCQHVADTVFLSQSRFSHLFKKEIGMTFSAYLIYRRLISVYTQILHGTSITQAALDAGFSDSSHFADVNRRIFGISASSMIQNLEFIKVS